MDQTPSSPPPRPVRSFAVQNVVYVFLLVALAATAAVLISHRSASTPSTTTSRGQSVSSTTVSSGNPAGTTKPSSATPAAGTLAVDTTDAIEAGTAYILVEDSSGNMGAVSGAHAAVSITQAAAAESGNRNGAALPAGTVVSPGQAANSVLFRFADGNRVCIDFPGGGNFPTAAHNCGAS